jgi:putative spermidine/putrescine transport system substrate-binding protein
MVTWGGSYQDLVEKYWSRPFTEATGIAVQLVSGPDLAKAKAQVGTKRIEWDLFDGSGAMITAGEQEELWEPLDFNIIKKDRELRTPYRSSSLSTILYTGGICYLKNAPKKPKTFAEFWDIKAFPGRRGLRSRVAETLEIGLLADGVDPRQLYPLDVERGFKALEKIKQNVSQWIAQTPQTISLLQNREIDFVYTYVGRYATARRSGIPIEMSSEQALVLNQYMAVLKGTPLRAEAMKFLDFILEPKQQAAMASAYFCFPVTSEAMGLVSPETLKILPKLDSPMNVAVDDTWWADKYLSLDERFKEWLYV